MLPDTLPGKKAHFVRLFFVLALLLTGHGARAGETDGAFGLHMLRYDSSEYDLDGRRLNRESGWVPGISGYIQHRVSGHGLLRLHGTLHHGRVDYDGQTQSGAAFQSRTGITQGRAGVLLGACFDHCASHLGVGWSGYGRHRDIRGRGGVVGLYEAYRWQEWNLSGSWSPAAARRLTLAGDLFRVVQPDMRVDLQPLGGGKPVLPMPDSTGWRLRLGYRPAPQSLALFVQHEWLNIDDGPFRQVLLNSGPLLVREPRSRARHWVLGVVWGWR